ncbi:hypothetical protein F5Y15DRAFT_41690 [Xylariaceae sp. FL0016]|nr:hypothetical protein F5Y15DRAFT_41690 [Xylariaceae sp. FL0016]
MPRPARKRPAQTRAAKAKSPVTAPTPAPASKHHQGPSEPSSDIYDVSDREKERAAERRRLREAPTARTRSGSRTTQREKALQQARKRRDSAMDRLENMTSTETAGADNDSNDANDKSDASVELGRRDTETPLQSRFADTSSLDLDDEIFGSLDATLDTDGPTSASAHRSADTSTLSATHFKRRPRAGSFLSRDDGPVRPSSRTGPNTPGFSSTFNMRNFKPRAREPSILGTAQKPRPQQPESEHGSEQQEEGEDNEEDIEDEFAPEAESTPLRHSRRRSGGEAAAQGSSSVNTRKRKSMEGHERRRRSSAYEGDELIQKSIEEDDSNTTSPLSSLPQDHSRRSSTPVMDEELMAPPLSSGGSEQEEIWPPLKSLARGRVRRPADSPLRRTPPPMHDNLSDMSSPPSLTHSPNFPEPSPLPARITKSNQKTAQKQDPKVTTADLASMLPRRRRRNAGNDPFSVDDDSEGEVDISGLGNKDELAHLDVRTRKRPAKPAADTAAKDNRNRGKRTPASGKKVPRTYGRSSDKENAPDDGMVAEGESSSVGPTEDQDYEDESSQAMVDRIGEELKNATRKFQEVDQWELEYEEMTQSSSPHGGR